MCLVFALGIFIIHSSVCGQIRIYKENYFKKQPGEYKTRSLDFALLDKSDLIVKPQKRFHGSDNEAFIHPSVDSIGLFNQINSQGKYKASFILTETSIVEVDTIFYNQIYQDPSQDWRLTFDVWYGIKINGRKFYTDYKIHDLVGFEATLTEFDQRLVIVAQNTGYDEYYDQGYPNDFFISIFSAENELMFSSNILNFNFEEEFWEPGYVTLDRNEERNGYTIVIRKEPQKISLTWTGKELVDIQTSK